MIFSLVETNADAKARVVKILMEWFGWKSIIDLGDITTARATEMLLPIWIMLMGKYQSPTLTLR